MKRNLTLALLIVLVYTLSAMLVARWFARATPARIDPHNDEAIVREPPRDEVFLLSGGKPDRFEAGANAAMDATLEVLSDYRASHKNVDWLTLQREVSRRLVVHRREWFLAQRK